MTFAHLVYPQTVSAANGHTNQGPGLAIFGRMKFFSCAYRPHLIGPVPVLGSGRVARKILCKEQ